MGDYSDYYNGFGGYDFDAAHAFTNVFAGVITFYAVIFLAVTALMVIAQWNMFKKAGQPGWAAVIPFYSLFVLYKISWGKPWLSLIQSISSFITGVAYISIYIFLFRLILYTPDYGYDYINEFANISVAMGLVSLLSIVGAVFSIIMMIKLARAFGKGGGGYACGLIFLNVIFMCILGFSKDIRYVGVDGIGENPPPPPGGFYGDYSAGTGAYQGGYQNSYQRNEPQVSPGGYCPFCGGRADAGARFCKSCGRQF